MSAFRYSGTRGYFPEVGEGKEEVDNVDALEPATGCGELSKPLDGGPLCVEGDLILEGSEPYLVDEGEEIGAHAAFDGALAGLVPRSSGPVLFLGATSRVVVQYGRVVVGACSELTVVGDGRRVRGLILGVGEDSAGGVTTVGAFERDLESHVEEIFLEHQSVVVVRRTVDL